MKNENTSDVKKVAMSILIVLVICLKIAVAVIRWNQSEPEFDPDKIDIGPQIEQVIQEQENQRMRKFEEQLKRDFGRFEVPSKSAQKPEQPQRSE